MSDESPRRVSEVRMAYDPIPDLAALVDGLHRAALQGNRDGCLAVLADLLTGPYARLRGGLLLDEPGRARAGTEAAIREALQAFTTKTGHLITTAEIRGWVAEAERGYDPAELPPIPGHAGPGHTADGPAGCRRCQMIRDNAHWLALPENPEG